MKSGDPHEIHHQAAHDRHRGHSGVANGTVEITMNNLASNQDACQGITAPLYILAG